MFLSRMFEKPGRPATPKPAAKPAFRPGLESLDDRITPSVGVFFGGPPPFAAPWSFLGSDSGTSSSSSSTTDSTTATHFAVLARSQAYAGSAMQVTVIALNANDMPARGYTGTVSITSSDSGATLPDDYTFTASDNGRHTFTVTPSATGSTTFTATDTASSSVTGSATVTVNTAPVVTHLFVETQQNAYSGSPAGVLVAALDASNHVVQGYTGTVHFTSTDSGGTLPADYTFTAGDRGVHVFQFTPSATGSDTVTATDTASSGVTGSATTTVAAAQVATHLAVVAQPWAGTGQSTNVYVVALDANNRVVTGYTGTVAFTSTDSTATLPADTTFSASDHGVKRVSVTFDTAGSDSLTATDTATASVTGSVTLNVQSPSTLTGFGFGGGFFGGPRGHGGWR